MRTLLTTLTLVFLTFFKILAAEPLFPVCKDGQWGFIDRTGTVKISPRFDEVWKPFNALIPVGAKDCELRCWSEERILARKGTLWGYANQQGEWLIPPKFSNATHFSGGLAGVMTEGRWAFIALDGSPAFSLEKVQGGYLYSEERAPIFRDVAGKPKWGFVDRQGKEVIPVRFEEVRSFHEGLAPAREGARWGYLDREGKWAIAPQFDDGDYFFSQRARVVKEGKAGFIGVDGTWAIQPTYEQAQRFSEELAAVSGKRLCGFVDAAGSVVIPLKFQDVRSFREGLAAAAIGLRYGFIDKEGTWVVQPQFESAEDFHEGLAAVSKDGRFGFIDRAGKTVIPFQFDEARPFSDGLSEVRIDEKWGYVDAKGTYVWAPSD
jgi:hypothetical protein